MRIGRLLIYSFLGVSLFGASVATSQDPTNSSPKNAEKDPAQMKVEKIFPVIEKLHWRKGGLENFIIADFSVVNRSKIIWKDIMVSCGGKAESGARIGSNTQIVYETLNPGESKEVKDFNMGIINPQIEQVECVVVHAVEVK